MALKKAVKTESKLRMAIIGPAGSGKTYSALRIAKALADDKPIALFDTEHGSAAKYSDQFDFDTDNISAPFHPDKFGEAIREAVAGGYNVVILDSMSHAWNGEGGVLDLVDQFARRMKNPNSFAAWKDVTPIQNRLTETVLGADIHIVVTMRSKTEYVLQDNGRGQQVPRKVGMAPIQKENWDYEFDVVLEMDAENNAIVTKTRCPALTGRVFAKPGAEVAAILREWLQGEPAPAPEPTDDRAAIVRQQFDDLGKQLFGDRWSTVRKENAKKISDGTISDPARLTVEQLQRLITGLETLRLKRKAETEKQTPQPAEERPAVESEPTPEEEPAF